MAKKKLYKSVAPVRDSPKDIKGYREYDTKTSGSDLKARKAAGKPPKNNRKPGKMGR